MGQATVFEHPWPKGSVLPRCNPSSHLQEHKAVPMPGVAASGRPWAQPPLLPPGHTERKREWRKRKERACSMQGAEARSTEGVLELSKGPVGREGWQTAPCVCCTGHIHGNKGGKRPPQSRLFIPFVRSFRLKRSSRFTQVSALEKWAN